MKWHLSEKEDCRRAAGTPHAQNQTANIHIWSHLIMISLTSNQRKANLSDHQTTTLSSHSTVSTGEVSQVFLSRKCSLGFPGSERVGVAIVCHNCSPELSTRIKDVGIAIRNSQGYFSIRQDPERKEGQTMCFILYAKSKKSNNSQSKYVKIKEN